jgi:hypothetical protein
MSFALYSFDPSTLMVDGYIHAGRYDSEQECNEAAIALSHYRIELISDFGACVIFESSWG